MRLRSACALVSFVILTACGGGGGGVTPALPAGTGNAVANALPLAAGAASALQSARMPVEAIVPALPAYTFVDLGAGPNGGSAVAAGANATQQGGNYVSGSGSCGKACSFKIYHAVVWSGSGSTPVDITPPLSYFPEAWVYGGAGTILVGMGITNNAGYYGYPHALLWRGATFAWKDINPAGDTVSYAYATNGGDIVGSGGSNSTHALLWSLTNLAGPADLHPGSAYSSSEALGINGAYQVGYAVTTSGTATEHAMLWAGSAAGAIDLTPSNVTSARAYAVDNAVEAGCGVVAPATASHALLWKGTPASMQDLNPTGFLDSCARAARGGVEVGYGHASTNVLHAVAWSGTAKSAVDLQLTLPSTYLQSQAFALDPHGNIVGAVLTAGGWHGAMWVKQ